MNLPLEQIKVEDRLRNFDQDHIDELKKSISENGLMQPIVVVKDNESWRLVAGGHRLESFRQLGEDEVPAIELEEFLREQGKLEEGETLTKGDLIKYEIEENVKRLSMGWQDRVLGVEKYHRLSLAQATKRGDTWLQTQTGELLGIDQSYISRFLILAARLRKEPDGAVANAMNVNEAYKLMLQEKLEVAKKKQIELLKAKQVETRAKASTVKIEMDKLKVSDPDYQEPTDDENVAEGDEIPKSYFFDLYFKGDALDTLYEVAKVKTIHHIVTDPPYGIDMDNLGMKNIDSVAETHQVEPNVALLMELLRVAKEVIHPKGFMCMWYDLDHHEKMQAHAKKLGWKVCRWPFIWAKSSSCMNQAAAYNFTKSTEVCMILRASEDAVLVEKQSNNFIVAPSSNSTAHPFHKPNLVWERLIRAVSYEGQTIVDPFAGSGSCLSAGLRMQRDMVGIEIDENHIHTGVEWMYKEHNEPSMIDMPVL